MECQDVREMADSYVVDELLTETNHEILRHLDTCPRCRADIAGRRALRMAVRHAFHRAQELAPSTEFTTQLRATLEHAATTAEARRGFRLSGWFALAATVLLAVTLGFAYRGREWVTATAALARAAVGDHRYCALKFQLAERPIPLEDAAQRYGAMYRVVETAPPDDVSTIGRAAHVLERHACVYDGRRFAHVVLDYGGSRVSLLVTASPEGIPIAVPNAARVARHDARIDSMSVVSVRTDRYTIFLVGELDQAELARLANAVAEPLARQLAAV